MTRPELVKAIAEQTGETQKTVKEILGAYESQVLSTLANDGKIQLVGFGTFEVADREARERRNPLTGEAVMCPAYKAPKFKFSNTVKKAFKG